MKFEKHLENAALYGLVILQSTYLTEYVLDVPTQCVDLSKTHDHVAHYKGRLKITQVNVNGFQALGQVSGTI